MCDSERSSRAERGTWGTASDLDVCTVVCVQLCISSVTKRSREGNSVGTLRVMSQRGDDTVVWDAPRAALGDADAVAAVKEAERIFIEKWTQGATAFAVKTPSAPVRLDTFDPEVETIIMVPRIVVG